MSLHHIIIGQFILKGEIVDDGSLAQKIADVLIKELSSIGVSEVDVDLELASPDITSD